MQFYTDQIEKDKNLIIPTTGVWIRGSIGEAGTPLSCFHTCKLITIFLEGSFIVSGKVVSFLGTSSHKEMKQGCSLLPHYWLWWKKNKRKQHPEKPLRKMSKLWHFHSVKHSTMVRRWIKCPWFNVHWLQKALSNKKIRCKTICPLWYWSLFEIFATSQKQRKIDWKHITSMKIVASGEQGGGKALKEKQDFNFISNIWLKKKKELECRTKMLTFTWSGRWDHGAYLSFSSFFQCISHILGFKKLK